MAQFTQLITTQKGQALIAKMLSGANNIKFSQVAVSDEVYELNQLESLTEILNIKQNVLVSKISRLNETTVKVEAAVNNDDLKVGYYMRTIGLYAIDPDDGEILHAVSIETSGNCYIPPYNGVAASGAYLKLITTVGNAENISLEVDPAAVATVGDLLTKIEIDGDISDTVIETEEITDQFPVPEGKEKTKTFMGKVRKFMKDFDDMKAGIITLGKLVNNGQTTEPGFALDARYGKTLGDGVAQLNSDIRNLPVINNTAGQKIQIGWTGTKAPFLVNGIYKDDIVFNSDLGVNGDITSGTILDFIIRYKKSKKDTFVVGTYLPTDRPTGAGEGYIQILRGSGGDRTIVYYHDYGNTTKLWKRTIFNNLWRDSWTVYCKIKVPKVAKQKWTLLQVHFGLNCKALDHDSQERCSA